MFYNNMFFSNIHFDHAFQTLNLILNSKNQPLNTKTLKKP
jgi:hypothetical protein